MELDSPMEGKVFKIVKAVGEPVELNEVVVVLDAMKMEIEVVAPAAGTVAELHVAVGDSVDAGSALATITQE